MIRTIGKYFLLLERPCWVNNITGHAIYTNDTRGKRQSRGTYFLGATQVERIGPLSRKEVAKVRRFITALKTARQKRAP